LRVPYRPLADRPWMKKLGFPPFFGPGGGNSFLLGAQRRGNLDPVPCRIEIAASLRSSQ
jgi:hypothetical protein